MIRKLSLACLCLTLSLLAASPGIAVKNRAPLAASAFYPLPLGSVKPRGWLLDQLRIQSEGLTGHLGEFWADVGPNSAWLGGAGEGWERGPYYLDGLIPLAYLLNDARLIAKAQPWMEWTLTHQRANGAIGPEKNTDWWPNMVMLKALTQYQEATGDSRVIPLMQKYFAYQLASLDASPLKSWAVYRWQDELASVLWLYNRTGDAKLLDLAHKLKGDGFDWPQLFADFPFQGKVTPRQAGHSSHGVNNAMGLKTGALEYLLSGDPRDRGETAHVFDVLDRFQGLPNGMFSADEHFGGKSPSQGTETCAVVESMYSLELDLGALGDAWIGDRLEKIAFNPLPGAQTADQWSHQYDQQPNQVICSLAKRDWSTNGPESNLFGLEPNFGCCTANLHQGWPKFAASLWMASADDGLAVAAYAPSEVRAEAGGGEVTVTETTEYPFRDRISLAIATAAPRRFPLHLRIPAWTANQSIAINGQNVEGITAGSYKRIEREWRQGDRVEIVFPMPVRAVAGFRGSVSIERGPLVYALQIGEHWSKLKQTGPVTDWEVYPTSAWNYGIATDLTATNAITVSESPVGRQPFGATPPVTLRTEARRLPQWVIVDDSAAEPPASPVAMKQKGAPPVETITLVPYGAARLRVTSFPVIKLEATQAK